MAVFRSGFATNQRSPLVQFTLMCAILKWQVTRKSTRSLTFFKEIYTYMFLCMLSFFTGRLDHTKAALLIVWTGRLDHAKAAQAVTNFFSFAIVKGTRQKAFP